MSTPLTVEVSVIDKLSAHVASMNKTVTGFTNNIQKQFQALSSGFMAIGAVTGVAIGLKNAVAAANQLAESAEGLALKTNLSTSEVQRWDYALKQNKSSMESAGKSFIILQKNAFDAANGTKEMQENFGQLGVSVNDANGNLKQTDQLSKEVIYALAGIDDVTTRTALAQKLLGKGAIEMLPLLSKGKDGIAALIGEADRYGQVLDESTIRKITEANDAMDRFHTQTTVIGAGIVSLISGPLKMWADGMNEIIVLLHKLKGDNMTVVEAADKISLLDQQIKGLNDSIATAKKSDFSQSFGLGDGSKFFGSLDAAKKKLAELRLERDKFNTRAPVRPDVGGSSTKATKSDNGYKLADDSTNIAGFGAWNTTESLKKHFDNNITEVQRYYKRLADAEESGRKDLNAVADASFSDLQEYVDRQRTIRNAALDLGESIGMAIAHGIEQGNGGLKEALKGTLTVFIGFLEKWTLAAIAENTLKRFAEVGLPGLLIGAAESAGAVALFETAKIGISSFEAGGRKRTAGWANVGERGRETAFLPAGTQIFNNQETRNMSTATHNVYVIRDDAGLMDRIHDEIRRGGKSERVVSLLASKIAKVG